MFVTVRPENLLPMRQGGRVEYVSMSDTFSIHLDQLSLEEARDIIERIEVQPEQMNVEPDAPPLPKEFQRRLEID
jgi:hypothetical protein